RLLFALKDDEFAPGDAVAVSVSPFEEIRHCLDPEWLRIDRLFDSILPANWPRVLVRLLDRDSWMPFTGLYPLSLLFAGFNENRLPNEQDASFHSGDL